MKWMGGTVNFVVALLLLLLLLVNGVPVDYRLRFSGPVTTLTAHRVRHGVEPDLICQPGPSPGIKTHSSPAAFSSNSLPPFFSLTLQLPAYPRVVPQAALSSTYSLRAPPLPTEPIRRGQWE